MIKIGLQRPVSKGGDATGIFTVLVIGVHVPPIVTSVSPYTGIDADASASDQRDISWSEELDGAPGQPQPVVWRSRRPGGEWDGWNGYTHVAVQL